MKRKTISITRFTGTNTDRSPYQQPPTDLPDSDNIRITPEGNAVKRPGYEKVNTATVGGSDYATSILHHVDQYGNAVDYAIAGSKIYEWGTVPSEVTDGYSITKTLATNKRASMLTWKDGVYVGNGNEPCFSLSRQTIKGNFVYALTAGRLKIFGNDMKSFGGFGKQGIGLNEIYNPQGFAIDYTNGWIFVVDGSTGYFKLKKFDLSWNLQLETATSSTVTGVAVNPTTSTVYLPGTFGGAWSVRTYNYSLAPVTSFACQSNTVTGGIAVSNSLDRVYVSHQVSNVMEWSDLAGTPVSTADLTGVVTGPNKFEIDSTNSQIYLPSMTDNKVYKFAMDFSTSANWVSSGAKACHADPVNSYVWTIASAGLIRTSLTGTGAVTAGLGAYAGTDVDIVSGSSVSLPVFHDLCSPQAPVATVGSGSNLTGTYKWKLTWEDLAGQESSGGIESNPLTLAGQAASLAVPYWVSSGSSAGTVNTYGIPDQVCLTNVYRASSAGGAWGSFYLITSAGSSVSTIADNFVTVVSGNYICPTVNQLIPTFKYLIQYNDILIGAGDYNNPSYVYWTDATSLTNPANENTWQSKYYVPVGADDGSPVNGLAMLGDTLIIGKDNAIYGARIVIVNDTATGVPTDISIEPYMISKEYGCVSHFTMKEATIKGQNVIMFVDKDKGVCMTNGSKAYQFTDRVDSDWAGYDKTYLRNAYGAWFAKTGEYWLSLTVSGTTNNEVWVFNKDGVIYKPWSLALCSMANVENSSGVEELWAGSFTGFVYRMETTEADATAAIDGQLTTPWLDAGMPSYEKVFDDVLIEFQEKGTWNMTLWWAVDGGAFSATNSQAISCAGTAGNRDKFLLRLPFSNTGKVIRFKISNANASEPFEVISIHCACRVRKIWKGA